ncbi:MAG: class IV adenylate cyclase [Candidatus Paceibacterota bacterium]
MNIEVEIKIKLDSEETFGEIKKKVSNGGVLIKAIRQVDDYYVPQHRDFFAHKPHPVEWMRIRTNPDKTVLEYVRSINPKDDGSQDGSEEYETEIINVDEFKKTLELLDFKYVITVDKQREYWMCGDIEVALDYIKGLGYFIEAEAKGNFKDGFEARDACVNFLENLGIQDVEKTYIKKGYPDLILETK